MEINTCKNEFLREHIICDTVSEIGVQSDIVLPDYCADIERILKCTLTPRISTKRLEGARLVISGTAFLRMVYLTADGNIGSFETQIPFSKNCEMSGDCDDPYITVKAKCDYVNCRALSARRFEVRGALSAKIRVKCRQKHEIIANIEGEGVEVKKERRRAIVPVNSICENFTVMEEYEVSGAPIGVVLRMNASPSVTDSKIVSGKLILKGEVALCIVYMPQDSDEIKTLNYTLPINHIMTAICAQEGDVSDIRLEIVRMSAEPSQRGENSEVAIEIFMEACADIKREEELEYVCDAYCIGYESSAEKKPLEIVASQNNLVKKHTASISPDAECAQIVDVFVDIVSCKASANEQGEVIATVSVSSAFLLKDAEDTAFVSEKISELEFSLGAASEYKDADCECEASICSATINSRKGADIEICVECAIKTIEHTSCLEKFEVDENSVRLKKSAAALTLYFAEQGEDVFDIAKRYNTSAAAVMRENQLTDMLINMQRAILIPIV